MECIRYPHVRLLIEYYAHQLGDKKMIALINTDVVSEDQAEYFSRFIWRMLDQMALDIEQKKVVLGCVDNSSMIPDIDYEISGYLYDRGFGDTWDRVCDEN